MFLKILYLLNEFMVYDFVFGEILQMFLRKKLVVGFGFGNIVLFVKDLKKKRKLLKLEDFLQMRDYIGVSILLEVMLVVIFVYKEWCLYIFGLWERWLGF